MSPRHRASADSASQVRPRSWRRPASPALAALVALLTIVALPSASASAQYPTPLPDFAHPATPHRPLMSPAGGTRDRPLPAIYLAFSDRDFNAGLDAAHLFDAPINPMTIAHETSHVAWDVFDLYAFATGVGRFDIAGGTCTGDDALWAPSAYRKLHLGWNKPTIVTRDGYYDIRQAGDQNRDAFLLYDPGHNLTEYFLVENRQRLAGSSDSGVTESGLLVWRVQEANTSTIAPLELMRPDGGVVQGDGADTFDGADR